MPRARTTLGFVTAGECTATAQRVVHAEWVATARSEAQFPEPVALEVAFAGRSNVGKSSLLNALVGRRSLVRTSGTPGCTRAVSFFDARTGDGALLRLVDLPGYGYAKRSKRERAAWGRLVERYLVTRPTLAAVVALVDLRRGITPEDLDLLRFLEQPASANRARVQTLIVATKTDKLSAAARKPALARLRRSSGRTVVPFSARDPRSFPEVWRQIRRRVGLST